jgi:hypothetical protein
VAHRRPRTVTATGTEAVPAPTDFSVVVEPYAVVGPYSKWYVVGCPSGETDPTRRALVVVTFVGASVRGAAGGPASAAAATSVRASPVSGACAA